MGLEYMISADVFHPVEDVVAATLDDETVLLNVSTGVYFGLDDVGTRIWQLLVEGADTEAIVDRLLTEYEVDREQLRTDVTVFVEQLHEHGLVRTGRA